MSDGQQYDYVVVDHAGDEKDNKIGTALTLNPVMALFVLLGEDGSLFC